MDARLRTTTPRRPGTWFLAALALAAGAPVLARATGAKAQAPSPARAPSKAPAPVPAPPAAPGRHLVGLNTSLPSDWDRSAHYADVFKTSNGFGSAPVDSLGWPATDFTVEVFGGFIHMNGSYALTFRGRADKVGVTSGGASISRLAHDAGTNTSTATITVTNPAANLVLEFTGTRRTPSSPAGSGVTDIRVMRPLTPGSAQTYPVATLLHTPLKAMLSKVQIVRFMDFTATNWSRTSVWGAPPWQPSTTYAVGQRVSVHPVLVYECTAAGTSAPNVAAAPTATGTDIVDGTARWRFVGYGRTTPAQASYNRWSNQNGFGWQGVGSPLEHAVRLANETRTDMWVNVPLLADDDFIRKMAQLLRYGSDGVMPYTSPQANPVFPPLDPDLKIYVEYSNELWNGAFSQSNLNRDMAKAEVAAYPGGKGPLNFDGEKSEWSLAYRRAAKRGLETSLLFREVFGDDQMMVRVRPALMTQQGGGDPIDQPLRMLLGYYANFDGEFVPQPRPPAYYFYGAGGPAYWWVPEKTADVTLDDLWTMGSYDPAHFRDRWMRADAARCVAMGLHRITYEGGPELTNPAFTADKGALGKKAWADPRMGQSILDHWKVWRQLGGEQLVFYQAIGDFRWGFADNPLELDTVKMKALEAILAAPPEPVTYGMPIPGAVDGNQWTLDRAWQKPGSGSRRFDRSGFPWAAYAFRAVDTAPRTVKVKVSRGGGIIAVYLDGVLLGKAPAVTGDMRFDAGTVSSSGAGLHGVIVRAADGSFTVESVRIE